jgi:uncharacterized Zn-finger protein
MGLFGKKFKCEACGSKFSSQEELMSHGRTHMQEADHSSHEHFICNACGEAFHSELELKSHGQQAHM